jgi:hypothetical protein
MKTNYMFIGELKDIRNFACEELIQTRYVKGNYNDFAYDCARLSSHRCYGEGWCPLRFTESYFTPKPSASGKGFAFY